MGKHSDFKEQLRLIPGGKARRPRAPRGFARPVRGWRGRIRRLRVTASEIRLTLLAGIFLGLGILAVDPPIQPVPADRPNLDRSDPYAEARRSREILKAQEGAPPPAISQPAAGIGPTQRARLGLCGSGSRRDCVVDGDTIVLGGTRIRIADIDTPETHQARCASERALGQRATRRMQDLLNAGPFALESAGGRDTDRYGRQLRIVTRGGQSLGDVLVSEGLARPWGGRREPWC